MIADRAYWMLTCQAQMFEVLIKSISFWQPEVMHLRRFYCQFFCNVHTWMAMPRNSIPRTHSSFFLCLLFAALEVFTCFIFPKSHIRFSTDFLHMYEKFSGLSFVCIQPSPRPRSTFTLLIFFLIFAHGAAAQLNNLKERIILTHRSWNFAT